MKIDAHIVRGRDFCARTIECGLKGCEHEPTTAQKIIQWQADDGEEYGQMINFNLPCDEFKDEATDKMLWRAYDEWLADEGKD